MDFVGKRNYGYIFSAILLIIGVGFLLFQGLNLGIDFTGGGLIEYRFDKEISLEDFRAILIDLNMDQGATLQHTEGETGIILRTPTISPAQRELLYSEISEHFPSAVQMRADDVGETIGRELAWRALLAIGAAFLGIIIYISIRFQLKYALAAIVAVSHDVLIVLGFFAVLQLEINTPFVAGLLTIAGYSINDSIVVFDRIRENLSFRRKQTYDQVINRSIMETLPRSLFTSLTTLVCVGAILVLGGVTLRTFLLTLFIGFLSGTYSSIFVAGPMLFNMESIPRLKTEK